MLQTLVDDGLHMIVRQRVKNRFSLPPGLDQPGVFQGLELVGNGGLGHPQQRRNITDAHLRLKQYIQNPYPGGISEDSEQLRQVIQRVLAGQLLLDLFHDLVMGVDKLTAFHIIAVFHGVLLHFNV